MKHSLVVVLGHQTSFRKLFKWTSPLLARSLTSNCPFNSYGCLYVIFDPYNPASNFIGRDDDNGGNLQLRIDVLLQPGTYILVVTSYLQRVTGPFTINIIGPAAVDLQKLTITGPVVRK